VDSPLLEPRTCPTCPGLIRNACASSAWGRTTPKTVAGLQRLPDDPSAKPPTSWGSFPGEVRPGVGWPWSRRRKTTRKPRCLALSGPAARRVQHRSARLDFPAVMTLAVERVGLPLPPTAATEASKPPSIGVLRPGASGTAGLHLAPGARCLAVCGGDVAAAIEDEGPDNSHGMYHQGAGPPLDESQAAHLLPQAAGWAERKKPLAPLPRHRDTLEYLDKIFRSGARSQLRPIISACWVSP